MVSAGRRSPQDRLQLADLVCLTGAATGYADLPIPNERDIAVVGLLRKARRTGGVDQLPELIRPDVEAAVLRAFALRMASFAVRRSDPDMFRLGLLALAVASLRSADHLADRGVLALLWHTAERLALTPAAEFAAAAAEVPDAPVLRIDRRVHPLGEADLAQAGYRAASDPDGFRYVSAAVPAPHAPQPPRPTSRWAFPVLRRRHHT